MTDKIATAKALARQGFRVFPLAIGGKVPALDGNWQKIATTDPAAIDRLWTCPVFESAIDYNIGIALGPTDVVVDVDVRDGKRGAESLRLWEAINEELPKTYEVTTASGGRHLYFNSARSGSFPARLAEHIDIKDHGDFVVGPGSEIDGRRYAVAEWRDALPCVEVLDRLAGEQSRLARTQHVAPRGSEVVEVDSPAAIARGIDWLAKSAPDHGTYTVACRVKDFGVSRDMCLELMMEHWPSAAAKGEEHVAFRVDNAYNYGQNAIGSASPEAEFDAVPPTIHAALPIRNVAAFTWNTKQDYLVRGFLNRGMLALMSGPSNAGKSPLALDLASAIAKGEPWRDRKVKRGYVLHISTEGWTGLENRMEALRRTHFEGAPESPLDFVATSINLRTSLKDVEAIEATVLSRSTHFGVPPALVVIDTLSHALAGGDESNAEHVRIVLRNCKRVAAKTGAAVLMLHHPTKDASSDYRGSSILLNDIDLLVKVEADTRTKTTRVTTPRVKEYGEIDPLAFRIKVLDLGADPEGDKITSVVVEWIDKAELDFAAPLTEQQSLCLSALEAAIASGNQTNATYTEWVGAVQVLRAENGLKTGEKPFLSRHKPVLVQAGLVAETQSGQYVRTSAK